MIKVSQLLQNIAPTLAAALDSPLKDIASNYILNYFKIESHGEDQESSISNLLKDAKNLQMFKSLDKEFHSDMKDLKIDVFNFADTIDAVKRPTAKNKPQIILSILFLTAYFLMLAAIFAVEASDPINMKKGENSLMGELQILFGVLTAGVGQVLSYWFGGGLSKDRSNEKS